jgi:hypothetical protein
MALLGPKVNFSGEAYSMRRLFEGSRLTRGYQLGLVYATKLIAFKIGVLREKDSA